MNRLRIAPWLLCGLALGLAACATPSVKAPAPAPSSSGAAAAKPPAPLPPVKIALIGDSTMCYFPPTHPARQEGWGMRLPEYFDDQVTVVNLAASGRSTKTFINEGRWARALAEKPDFVLIQFGHNDSHAPANPESTNAATDYRAYLRQYVDEARGVGAVPVFITPVSRRTPTDTLQPYADAMKAVAAEKGVPVIDLHAASAKLYAELGPERVLELESRTPNGPRDMTHFSAAGAQAIARLVVPELIIVEPRLKPYLKPPNAVP